MAKKSKIAKNEQRKAMVARYAERRQELKRIISSPNSSDDERMEAQSKLNKMPRDASPIRVRNRAAAPVATCVSLACLVSVSARWLTMVSCLVSASRVGEVTHGYEAQL